MGFEGSNRGRRASAIRAALVGVLLMALAACGGIERKHGYLPPADEIAEIEVGRDTRETVSERIGRPSTQGILDDSGWYYVKTEWRTVAFRAPEPVSREVLAISFDPRGVVANIETFGLRDGRVVRLTRRITESSVESTGFLRQAFGNLGQFNPAGLLDEN
ncbi:MAG: outer membrane protein assembly factor BamE [Alphaproteobacteria bacterium]|nr:outer membrane protein assembly factor BamE [Alphaproteobacteria bacterium]